MQPTSSRHSFLLPLVAAVLSLAACSHPTQVATDTAPTGGRPGAGGVMTTAIRARYEGVLPCADCTGIQTELMLLADGSYTMRETYQGKATNTAETRGRYDIANGTPADPNAVVYQLTPEQGAVRYFAAANDGQELRLLDANKQELPAQANTTLKLTGGAPVQQP
ncbi:MAG: copper resistance protein NlpE [Archangium sp.]